MPVTGFIEDRILDNMQTDRRDGGKKADWFWGGVGNILGMDSEGIVDDAHNADQQRAADDLIGGSGFSKEELSKYGDLSTPNAVKGAVSQATRARTLSDNNTSHTQGLERVMAPIAAELKAQQISANADRDIRNKQFLLTWQQGQNDRADAREQHADELALRREAMEREDMRYNENIARMDRKDRQQSIQTLVAGLANLGAAFAL